MSPLRLTNAAPQGVFAENATSAGCCPWFWTKGMRRLAKAWRMFAPGEACRASGTDAKTPAAGKPTARNAVTMKRIQVDASPSKDSLHIFHPSFYGQGNGKIRNLAAWKKIGSNLIVIESDPMDHCPFR
jgi:hypothetical protein